MRCLLLMAMLLGLTGGLFSQTPELTGEELKRYRKISKRSQTAPDENSQSAYYLAKYLTETASTNLEKTRAIYVWVASNITFDMNGFKSNILPEYKPRAVLSNRYAVCEGFARLFNELCQEAGLKSEIIRGYAHGFGYENVNNFEVSNHAWNAVLIKGEWQLIDVTWAARKSNNTYLIRPLEDKYFFARPEVFILDHLPEIPAWQLLSKPVSKEAFERNKISIVPGSFNYNDSLAHLTSMNSSRKAISYQLAARNFNPENELTTYRLGVEYRFRALDSLDAVYNIGEDEFERFTQLEKSIFTDLDEAALYFALIKPNSSYYKSAQDLLDDTEYERGVFKYEVGHRLLDIYHDFPKLKKELLRRKYSEMISSYYKDASSYFSLISKNSYHFEGAQTYLTQYLKNPFEDD